MSKLWKEIYKTAFELSEQFPEKPSLEAGLDEEIAYTEELLQVLEEGTEACGNKKIQKLSQEMKELLEDERLKEIRSKADKEPRFGHKTATSTFYGYKNHLAMTEERIIAGISVTDGGPPEGQELPKLIEKAKGNGSFSVPLFYKVFADSYFLSGGVKNCHFEREWYSGIVRRIVEMIEPIENTFRDLRQMLKEK